MLVFTIFNNKPITVYLMQIRTILIIDDEKTIRENIAEYLQNFNFKTILAEDGATGVQLAIENKPDLIVCDIDMPVLNGYEVYKQIQQILELALTPFIFLTGKSSSEELRTGMLLGADDYITKPFKLNDILLSISKRLEKSERIKSASEQKLQALTENQLVGIFFYQETGFVYTNKKFRDVLGYKQQTLRTIFLETILTGGNKKDNLEKTFACLEGVLDSILFEGFVLTNNHKTLQVVISAQHIKVKGIKTLVGIMQVIESANTKPAKVLSAYSEIVQQLKEENKSELAEEIEGFIAKVTSEEADMNPKKNTWVKQISPREKEVLTLICMGKSNAEIAKELFLSIRTIENHRAKLMQKTNSKNTAQLVVCGIKNLDIDV